MVNAEAELQRLRKLPSNKVCPNCGKEDSLGFQAVCVPFRSFVCSDCKSAHQSFSHRCKSVSMSNWTMDEVCMLNERSGGNAICSKTWLSGVPSGQFPPKGNQDAIKKFVQQAYIECRWKQVAAQGGSSPGREARVENSEKEPRRPTPASVRAAGNLLDDCRAEPVRTPASKPAQTPAPSVDLLDDSFFNPTPASAPAPEVIPSSNAFSFVMDSPAAPVPTALGQGGFDPFGFEAVPGAAGFGLDFNPNSFISSPAPPAQPTCCASPCAGVPNAPVYASPPHFTQATAAPPLTTPAASTAPWAMQSSGVTSFQPSLSAAAPFASPATAAAPFITPPSASLASVGFPGYAPPATLGHQPQLTHSGFGMPGSSPFPPASAPAFNFTSIGSMSSGVSQAPPPASREDIMSAFDPLAPLPSVSGGICVRS
uniref:Arf-GAP domain-containing protein n=1 Tax=Noctiluca scintillans TaxID=2966 RepID=A0A7S1AQ45_NOCSC